MKILVLNSGSSSLKFQLIETSPGQIERNEDRLLVGGMIEKIGTEEAIVSIVVPDKRKARSSREILEHKDAIRVALEQLVENADVLMESPEEIEGVGHRIVHGGEKFAHSTLMTDEVVEQIEDSIQLAPLHNPANLKGYYAAREMLPGSQHAAVFDTSFHQTLPPHAYVYGLPYILYARHKIRRYGFHGTSHRYVSYRFAQIHGAKRDAFKMITCHLGNGCSVCAIDHGKSVDTSMGFTPLEGLVMGTRAGDVDVAAVLHVMSREELSLHEVNSLLNKHSGLYGISGVTNDMKTLLEESGQGNARAKLAVDVFCYRVKKYLGAYWAALNGPDTIIFTGGIGENSSAIREQICDSLDSLGIRLDPNKNQAAVGKEMEISADGARCRIWVIPTNEELLIARDTLRCILDLPFA